MAYRNKLDDELAAQNGRSPKGGGVPISVYRKAANTAPATASQAPVAQTVPTVAQQEQDHLKAQRDASQQQAYVSYMRMMKYLPQLNKQAGIAGLGVSESGRIAAENDLYSRMAQAQMAYDAGKEQENQERSAAYLSQLSSALEGASSMEEIDRLVNAYKPYLSQNDANMLDLYINESIRNNSGVQAAMKQNALQNALASAGYSGEGGVTFDKNKTRWWGDDKWTVGDGFSVKDSEGNKYNVKIAEVNPNKDDDVFTYVANAHSSGDVFLYRNELYMVRDGLDKDGKTVRNVYLLAPDDNNGLFGGDKQSQYGEIMRLYKSIS